MPDIDDVRYDPRLLVEDRRRANAARGELITLVSDGTLTPWEALTSVGEDPDATALRKVSLEQILMARPGASSASSTRVVEQVMRTLSLPSGSMRVRDVTIGYVLDSRSAGRRLLAVLDAFLSHGVITDAAEVSAWPGFPYSPPPSPLSKES